MATLTLTPNPDKKKGTLQADAIDGLAGNDTLQGDAGNDTLLGQAGNDSLDGGTGDDRLLGDTGNDTLQGSAGNDFLDGGADSDRLDGGAGAGADTLDGGTGADTLIGGDGNDLYFIDNIGDKITEVNKPTSGKADTVRSSIDFSLPDFVEHLLLQGSSFLKATGNSLANRLTGNLGNNQLDGGAGDDTLQGGDGDDTLIGGTGKDRLEGGDGSDTYRISSKEDQIVETANGGDQDEIESSTGYDLTRAEGVEALTLTGTASLDGQGNALDNTLSGNEASNQLQGRDGNDSLIGNAGDDTLEGGSGDDTLEGGDGQDRAVYSGQQSDYNIVPSDEADTWTVEHSSGEDGTDRLTGIEILVFADETVDLSELGSELPQLSFDDLSLTEGHSGSKLASFQFSLSKAATEPVSVDYATQDVTATANSDYTPQTGTLTFAPGETRKSLSISIVGDSVLEPDETFLLQLLNPLGLDVPKNIATVKIVNDDKPKVSITGLSTPEGNSGTTPVQVQVSLSAAATETVTVQYATLDGTAQAGSDYTTAQGTLTFNPGDKTKPITLNIKGDTTREGDEFLQLLISNPGGATLDPTASLARITLTDDDAPAPEQPQALPTLSITGTTITEGQSGASFATLTVNLSAASSQPVTVNYATQDGTATAGSDYVSTSNTLNFAANQTTATLQVPVLGDTQVEPNETFKVNLSSPVNATLGSNSSAGVTINNDDLAVVVLPTVSISGATVTEGQSGASFATLTVNLSAASSQPVSVDYSTQDGTAQAGSDYVSSSNTLTFAPNQTTATLQVPILGDTQVEPNESFKVNLSSPVNATLGGNGSAVVTINNDDQAAVVLPTLSISGVTVKEGNSGSSTVNATVTLSAASSETVTVNYATQDGTATANSDYIGIPDGSTLYLAPGVTRQTIALNILGDTTVEADETFKLVLSNAGNALLDTVNSSALITLSNDDTASQASGSYTKGQAVINLGRKYGRLIKPVQVDGDHYYYYWDVSGDGTSADMQGAGYANDTDYVTHDWLDKLFQQDVNGQTGGGGNTDNTYRYATINGVKLALPTIGDGSDFIDYYGYRKGTAVQDTANNPTYDDYLAIWDAYNGTGTGGALRGTPPGWVVEGTYWSATPAASGHPYIYFVNGLVYYDYDSYNLYVAVEVL